MREALPAMQRRRRAESSPARSGPGSRPLAPPSQTLIVEASQEGVALAHHALGQRDGVGQLVVVELVEGRPSAAVEHLVPAPAHGMVQQDPSEAVVLGDDPRAGRAETREFVLHQMSVSPPQGLPIAHSRGLPVATRRHSPLCGQTHIACETEHHRRTFGIARGRRLHGYESPTVTPRKGERS